MRPQGSTTKKPNWKEGRAITDAKIATIYQGKRIVQPYRSGEKLKGKIEN